MIRVIIYCRFSPRPDADESTANETQLDQCRAYADRHEWLVVEHFEDADISGDSLERPGLWNAIAALKKGDVLLVWKLNRLARDEFLGLTIERQVEAKGARIVSACDEGNGRSATDELVRGILRVLAQYEKRVQAEQTSARMKFHQSNGLRMGRADRCPYGWRYDPTSELNKHGNPGGMVTDEEEQRNINRILACDIGGLSSREIAAHLNGDGHFCRGKPWNHQLVCRILARSEA